MNARIGTPKGRQPNSGCLMHPMDAQGRLTFCPRTGRSAAVHTDLDMDHGPMCAEHAREELARCLRRACERAVYRSGGFVTEPTYRKED